MKLKTDTIFRISLLMIILGGKSLSQTCPPQDTTALTPPQNFWSIPVENNWSGIEIMTWNVKQFPLSSNTISYVNEVVSDVLPDVVLFQEITDDDAYNDLANGMPAYTFLLSNYGSSGVGLELGIAFRNDCIEFLDSGILFTGEEYWFAWRLPFYANLRWHCGNATQEFQIINIHFKCCNDGFDRRVVSSEILRDYIQDQENSGNSNIILAGDFNDEIDDPDNDNSLLPLVEAIDLVYFTTTPIVDDNSQQSFPFSYNSFIDHILISSGFFDENDVSGEVKTLRIDDYTGSSTYQNHLSDHRPVLWKIWIESGTIPEGLVINEIMQNPEAVSDTYGEWFELLNTGTETINLEGLIIQDNNSDSHIISSGGDLNLSPGEYFVLARNGNVVENGGLEADYVYSDFNLNNMWDSVVLKHPSGVILDEVSYDNGLTFPDPVGASMYLIDPNLDNEVGGNWMTSSQTYGDGDLGTPGLSNSGSSGILVEMFVNDGWNLIGLPVQVVDSNYLVQFPSSVEGTLFGFDEVYTEEHNLLNGNGYWLRFNNSEMIALSGQEINSIAITLSTGWNLISGISHEVNIDDIVDSENIIISGTIYEFDQTYISATVIKPGKGYWIKSNSNGIIMLTFSEI